VSKTFRGGDINTSEAEIRNGVEYFQSVAEEKVLANY
jgi:hypothetical protein